MRIYQRNSNGNWQQLGADIDGEAAGDQSGYSVSLSADGSTVAIGAYNDDSLMQLCIYQRNSTGNWHNLALDRWRSHSTTPNSSSPLTAAPSPLVLTNDDNGSDAGHVRIYQCNSDATTRP